MKKLLTLTVLGTLLALTAGCHFCECLWRGPQTQQCPAQAPAYNPCAPAYAAPGCESCGGATPMAAPGPENYAPVR